VGARNAQAISKVAIAGLGRLDGSRIDDIRIAGASLYETPVRLYATERALLHQSASARDLPDTMVRGRASLVSGLAPIDDIRSTARYRSAVAANLVDEFVRLLARSAT
jgi:CO/xanthine dehydrogenase FAD-binding subunit